MAQFDQCEETGLSDHHNQTPPPSVLSDSFAPTHVIRRFPNSLLLRSYLAAVYLDLPEVSVRPSG